MNTQCTTRTNKIIVVGGGAAGMMAAIAAAGCERPVTITGAQAVNKSYPAFFEDYQRLCAQ